MNTVDFLKVVQEAHADAGAETRTGGPCISADEFQKKLRASYTGEESPTPQTQPPPRPTSELRRLDLATPGMSDLFETLKRFSPLTGNNGFPRREFVHEEAELSEGSALGPSVHLGIGTSTQFQGPLQMGSSSWIDDTSQIPEVAAETLMYPALPNAMSLDYSMLSAPIVPEDLVYTGTPYQQHCKSLASFRYEDKISDTLRYGRAPLQYLSNQSSRR